MRLAFLSAPLLLTAVPAFAMQSTPEPTPAAQTITVKSKRVCRTSQITGRRIAKTVCMTTDQWAAYDRAQEEAAKNYVNGVNGIAARAREGGSNGYDPSGSVIGIP